MESAHTMKFRYPDVHEAHSSSVVERAHTVNYSSVFNRRIDRQWCGSHMVVLVNKKGHWRMQDHGQLSSHSSEWKSDKWGCVLCRSFMGCYAMQTHLQWQHIYGWWSGKITKGQGKTFHGDKHVQYLHCGQNFTGICTYQCHQTVYWKCMQFIKC